MLPGSTYHLFNHANGRENLFSEAKNYDFFLGRLSKHVLPVAQIYAYCLMPDHFHLLLKIRDTRALIEYFKSKKEKQLPEQAGNIRLKIRDDVMPENLVVKDISKSFSNLFNSYTQAYNKMYARMGSLFMQNMKRKEVFDDASFCNVVHYIHANPVQHQFVKKIDSWPHSSYKIFLSNGPTKLERDHVLNIFGGREGFIKYHEQPVDAEVKWFDS